MTADVIKEFVFALRQVNERSYPLMLPQGVTQFPAVVFQQVSRVPHNSFDGASKMDFLHFDVTVYADTSAQVYEVSEQIRKALEVGNYTHIKSLRFKESGSTGFADSISKFTMQYEYRISFNRIP